MKIVSYPTGLLAAFLCSAADAAAALAQVDTERVSVDSIGTEGSP